MDGVLPADDIFCGVKDFFECVIGVNGEACLGDWFETRVGFDVGGNFDDAWWSSAVKKWKAPLLDVVDTGRGIFDEHAGDGIILKSNYRFLF